MKLPQTFEALVNEATNLNLYKKLLFQLNKDLLYANINLSFDATTLPERLKFVLHERVYYLIQHKFSDYLNLLYIVDVSEPKVRKLDGNDTLKLSEVVTFLILQREWQKVWYKEKYS